MTSPDFVRPTTARVLRVAAIFGTATVVSVGLVGCGEEPAPPPPVVEAPPPPPPPAPRVTPISELMARYAIDERVRLPEEQAPDTDEARIAVLQFFDAIVRGDASTAGGYLSMPDRLQLEQMQADGSWSKATEQITRVDVRTGRSPLGDPAVLGVYHVGFGFEPQLWTYRFDDGQPQFDAEPTPPSIMNQLSGEDWIGAWYGVLAEELAKADEPDELVTVPQQNFDKGEDADRPAAGGDGPSGVPFGPGGSPRRPVREPIDPPPFMPGGPSGG